MKRPAETASSCGEGFVPWPPRLHRTVHDGCSPPQPSGCWNLAKIEASESNQLLKSNTNNRVKCVKALKHSAVWPNYCHSLSQQGPSRQTHENGLSSGLRMIWCFHVVTRSFRLCLCIPVSDLSFPVVWVFFTPSYRCPGCRWQQQGCCLASRAASNLTCSSQSTFIRSSAHFSGLWPLSWERSTCMNSTFPLKSFSWSHSHCST